MSSTLVIQLQHNAENKQCWLIADSDGNITQSAAYDDLRTISKHCADKSIVVLIPADEVLLLSLTLPVMKKNRLQQAIPFAIEEQLSDKADTFHIILLKLPATYGADNDKQIQCTHSFKVSRRE